MTSGSSAEPSLRQLQQWMAARIAPTARADLHLPGPALGQWLQLPAGVSANERLAVHAAGYPARVHESLAETYPGVARCVGEDGFRELTRRYAASVPLSSYNLNDAGERMPAFLRRGVFLLQTLPFLADLAELEWCIARAFHAWQQTPFVPRTLGWSVDEWARAILHFQPAVATLSSPWPILDLWTARDVPPDRIYIDSHNHPQSVVIRRIGLTVRVELVCADESRVLRLLLHGLSLGDALASVAAAGRDPEAVLAWFRRWVKAEMIIGASLPNAALVA